MHPMDTYLPAHIREGIEANYYAKVSAQASLENAMWNAEFLESPIKHVALYSDHGVVHVRDVAETTITVLDTINGLLIPARDINRLEFMKGLGVQIAYCHDIGMIDFSAFGRFMHPDFVIHEVFSPAFDGIVEAIWEGNYGNVPWRLAQLNLKGLLPEEPGTVLRELLAMGGPHSKIPAGYLIERDRLREVMVETLTTDMQTLYHRQRVAGADSRLAEAKQGGDPLRIKAAEEALTTALAEGEGHRRSPGYRADNPHAAGHYRGLEKNAFFWLTAAHPDLIALADDVVDTVRALRAADALRKRGSELRTSAGYQIFTNHQTAHAVFALEEEGGETYLFEAEQVINAGEANIASSELTPEGDLRVSFYRGSFATPEATRRGAYNVAFNIGLINQGIVDVFQPSLTARAAAGEKHTIRVLIENTRDNMGFGELVLEQLMEIHPELARQSRVVPSLAAIPALERERYLAAPPVEWSLEERQDALRKVASAGYKTAQIDPDLAFEDVHLLKLNRGQTLVEAGSPPGFVYVPAGEGVIGYPLGGYEPFTVKPWTPLGTFSIIRGAPRASTLVVQADLALLVIPEETYLRHWHSTYTQAELMVVLEEIKARKG
jgi:hypothetical protein